MMAVAAAMILPGDRQFFQRDAVDKGNALIWHLLDTH
jgi:hypothetical protein